MGHEPAVSRAPPHPLGCGADRWEPLCRCRVRRHWRTTGCSSWVNCRNSAARSWRSCASRWRRVSYTYNLAGVLNLTTLTALALRVRAVKDSGGGR